MLEMVFVKIDDDFVVFLPFKHCELKQIDWMNQSVYEIYEIVF